MRERDATTDEGQSRDGQIDMDGTAGRHDHQHPSEHQMTANDGQTKQIEMMPNKAVYR